MKLLICKECGDIFNLTKKEKSCGCGKTKGRYINDIHAEYEGNAQPIGISNPSFRTSYLIQAEKDKQNRVCKPKNPECCKGVEFTAFFIPEVATTLTKID